MLQKGLIADRKEKYLKYLLLLVFIPLVAMTLLYLFFILPTLRQDIYNEKMQHTEEMIDIGLSILSRYHELELQGILTQEEAKSAAADMIRSVHYGETGLDYFWINDFDAIVVAHPFRPDLEGEDVYDYKDPKGLHLFQEFIRISNDQGAGHLTYHWQYYDETDRFEEKLSFVAGFEPWDWIIGTGVYLTDLEAVIAWRRNIAITLMVIFFGVSTSLAIYYYKNRLTEQELLESEKKYRLIAENTAETISILDLNLRYKYISPAIYRTKGFTPEEAMAKSLEETIAPECLEEALGMFVRKMDLLKKGLLDLDQSYRLEMQEYCKDGSLIWVDSSISFITDENDNPVGILSVSRDITQMKETKLELKRLNEELEERVKDRTKELEAANRELAAFTYSVSHDLRAPVRSIEGFSEAVLEDYADKLDEQGRNYLERIASAGKRMNALIEDLLKLSRVTRQELHRDTINLSAMVEAYATHLQEGEENGEVKFIIEPDLYGTGDGALLRIALDNLVDNAWKYSIESDPAVIEFGIKEADSEKIYYVQDNGVGFDMNHAEKLFRPFQRLHDPEKYPGTGIGLSIVQRIIERHGGEIWAEAKPGSGAIFYFTLPDS